MNRKFTAWLAILGVALNALWPLLAHAGPQEFVATICSANGTRSVAVTDGGAKPPQVPPASSSLPHCPFCLGVSDHSPALAAAPAVDFTRVISTLAAMVAGISGGTSFTHPSAAPRGPPSLP